MPRGKTIKLFLMDGDASGRIKCSLTNWTGVAYRIPRISIADCREMAALRQSGVYFLFGTDINENATVYIGQAGSRRNGLGLLNRILEPHESISDWTDAVLFTTSNNSLGPTEISYLENRFCNMAKDAGRYVIKNGNEPNLGNITEETESEMEEFIDYATVVMSTLGYKVFDAYTQTSTNMELPTFQMEYRSYTAQGRRTNEGFVILKGSTINPQVSESCPRNVVKARNEFASKIDSNNQLVCDVLLPSPSAAAKFVSGTSISGNLYWKDHAGVSLGQIEQMEVSSIN